jgi:hypothetical protein
MGVCLMTYIPHDAVLGRIVDIVQSNCQLDRTKARSEVPGILGTALDNITPHLLTVLR